MNKKHSKFSILTLTALLAVLVLGLSGCATTTGTPDVAKVQRIVQFAATEATSVYLYDHPQDRAGFEAARNGVQALIDAGTFQLADLSAVLQKLPIKELKSGYGRLALDATIFIWNEYGQEVMKLDSASTFTTYILPVAQSLVAGLDAGLAADTAAKARKP